MLSEANGGDKSNIVTEEQFSQVLTKATNLWYAYHHNFYFHMKNMSKIM